MIDLLPATDLAPTDLPTSSWQLVIGANNVGPTYELSKARSKSISLHVDDSSSLTFTLDGHDDSLQYITELVTDVWVYHNNVLVNRYRIGPATDSIDGEADTYDISFTAFDYREWLKRQILSPAFVWSYRGVTEGYVIRDMITKIVNNQAGIHPPITVDDSKLSTTAINFDSTVGTSINEAIAAMTGFGWQVIPNSTMGITLVAKTPMYYNLNNTFVLMYGATISKLTRTLDTGGYANSSIMTGDMNLAPVQSDASGIATMPMGRFGLTTSDPSIVDTSHLHTAAANNAVRDQNVVPTWSCDLAAGAWRDKSDAWIGDICQFIVKKGRININDKYRITDMTININDDSTKADGIQITVAKPATVPPS
jgi:hypothetical protein